MSSMDDLINILADLGGVIATRVSKLLALLSQNKVRKSRLPACETMSALVLNEHRQFFLFEAGFPAPIVPGNCSPTYRTTVAFCREHNLRTAATYK
jgi:glutamate racemase